MIEAALQRLKDEPEHLKTQEMYDKAVHMGPYGLKYVPDHFKINKKNVW